jgi:hypothetical protein
MHTWEKKKTFRGGTMKKSKLRVPLPELIREILKDFETLKQVKCLETYSAVLTRLF